MARKLRVGVLALQGAFGEHINILHKLPDLVESAVEVRSSGPLLDGSLDALILPGGESTTIAMIAERNGLLEPLRAWVRSGKPIWGTCAGMILLSDDARGTKQGGQTLIGGLHVQVKRNAFGHQLESFIENIPIPALGSEPFPAVFIRAPTIEAIRDTPEAREAGVQVLATSPSKGSCIVAVQQGAILATSFHPELTNDTRFHAFFARHALARIADAAPASA
nr:hypothetical protein HK105_007597 [Polyrhizophydium stewartii]